MHSEYIKRTLFLFSVFLLVSATFLIPLSAKTLALDSRFGVNAFILNRYSDNALHKPLEALEDLRVGWIREEFIWSEIEPQKGVFMWEPYDTAIHAINDTSINILGIIDYSAPWATGDPARQYADKYMPDLKEWERYVAAVVDRYGDTVHYWQIWNEPNIITFFRPEPNVESYVQLLEYAYRIIKNHDKNARVLMAGMSGIDIGYLEIMKRMGAEEYFDIIALHPYRSSFRTHPEDNGFMQDLKRSEDISKMFEGKPVWFTEFGWPNDSTEGVSEAKQAEYLVRTYVMSFSFPHVEKLFWYDLRDDGDDRAYREHNFGLVSRDYTKKAAYMAYQNLIRVLEHTTFAGIASAGDNGIYDFRFEKNDGEVRVVWRAQGESFLEVENIGDVRIYDMYGKEKVIAEGKSTIETISSSPLFIVTRKE